MRRTSFLPTLFCAISIIATASCTSKIVAVPSSNSLTPGYSLKLIKHCFKITFDCKVYKNTEKSYYYSRVDGFTITLLTYPSDKYMFVIDPKYFRPSNISVNKASINSSNRGIMNSINLNVADKTGETIIAIAKTVATVAPLSAVAGNLPDTSKPELIDTFHYELYIEPKKEDFPEGKLSFTKTLGYTLPESYKNLGPQVTLTFTSEVEPNEPNFGKDAIIGVPYLDPLETRVTATVDGQVVSDEFFPIAQLGQPRYLDASNTFFSDANTSITFDPVTGVPTLYEYSGSSAANKMASTANDLATEISTGVNKVKTAVKSNAVDAIMNEKALIEAQTDKVKALSSLLAAQQELQKKQNP